MDLHKYIRHETSIKIFLLLLKDDGVSTKDIMDKLNIPQSHISKYTQKLRDINFIVSHKEMINNGSYKLIYYLNNENDIVRNIIDKFNNQL